MKILRKICSYLKMKYRGVYIFSWYGLCAIGIGTSYSMTNNGYLGTPLGWLHINVFSVSCIIVYFFVQLWLMRISRRRGEVLWRRERTNFNAMILAKGSLLWHMVYGSLTFFIMGSIPIVILDSMLDHQQETVSGVHVYPGEPILFCDDVLIVEVGRYPQAFNTKKVHKSKKLPLCISGLDHQLPSVPWAQYVNIHGRTSLAGFFVTYIEVKEQ